MPKLSKSLLLEKIISAVERCGWRVICLSSLHPFYLRIFNDVESHDLKVYIWTITPGGKNRALDEYRIQITGIGGSFVNEEGVKTVILGWWEDVDIFAGFDYNKHSGKLGGSPSMQIKEEYLRAAYVNGFSVCSKANQEVVVAFRPDFFVEYVKNLENLHGFGESAKDLKVLESVAANPLAVNNSAVDRLAIVRKTTVLSVKKALRDSSFSDRVLTAYSFRCAVCGVQLNLVEAAHIVPVAANGGSDETSNGLALCTLHHRAFDNALIAVDDNYKVLVNEKLVETFKKIRRAGGEEMFRSSLRPVILLPPTVNDRPHVDFLRIGRELRRWVS